MTTSVAAPEVVDGKAPVREHAPYRLWQALKMLYFNLLSRLQVWLLRTRGVDIAPGFFCEGPPFRFSGGGRLVIGKGVRFRTVSGNISIAAKPGATVVIGDGTFINSGVSIVSQSGIEIGANTGIAENAMIWDTDLHEIDEGAGIKTRKISLGRNVWIGRSASVLRGVTIGDHSVVAASAVVTKPIAARQIWAGNPAVFVRDLHATDAFKRA